MYKCFHSSPPERPPAIFFLIFYKILNLDPHDVKCLTMEVYSAASILRQDLDVYLSLNSFCCLGWP